MMNSTIMVYPHDGPRGFGDISGCFLNAFMIMMIPGLLMVLDRRRFYGSAWKYRYIQGVEKSYLRGSLRLGEGFVASSW